MKKIYTLFLILLFSISISSQNFDFQWQNPKVSGNILNEIVSLSANKLLVFGDVATMMTTTDGGTVWTADKIDDSGIDIKAASFIDANTVVACGDNGLLLKTTDGGESGIPLTSNTTETLWDIDFLDANTGYAVGSAGVIIKTTDGGTTWSQLSVPVSNVIYAVHVVAADNIFIGTSSTGATQILSRSTDGGASWTNVTPAGYTSSVYSIQFVDALTGYVGGSSGKVLKTTDGGANFAEIKDFGSGSNYTVFFSDALNGFVPTGELIQKTTDGGTTWTELKISDETLRGITGNENGIFVVGSYGAILKSSDGGTTWEYLSDAVTTNLMREVTFINNLEGYIASGSSTASDSSGFLLKTTNGGITWEKMAYNFKIQVTSLAMPTSTVWYATTSNNKIFKTTDAGETWTQQVNPAAGTNMNYKIEFVDENTGYIVGLGGRFLKTTDGTNWTAVTTPFGTTSIYNMKVFDAQTVIIVGISAGAHKTTDGGTTWTALSPGIPGNFFALEFLDSNFGLIAGYASSTSYISYTTDGGTTWTPYSNVPAEVSGSVWGFGIRDVNHIWFADINGNIVFTVDGGVNWSLAESFTGNAIYDFAVVGDDMWLIGNGGTIIKGYSDPVIPVELVSFSYSVNGSDIVLEWKTATEVNNKGFQIERKSDNGWKSIGFVAGAGNSTDPITYSYVDKNYPKGALSYRLKQMDYDGSYEYSNVINIDAALPVTFSLSQNFPNPFNPSTSINYSVPENGILTLKVYNVLGSEVAVLVNEFVEAGEYSINFNAADLTSGIYLYELSSASTKITRKMILLK